MKIPEIKCFIVIALCLVLSGRYAGAQIHEEWTGRYYGHASLGATGMDVFTDHDGNSYMAGYSQGAQDFDILVIKYDPLGDTIWTAVHDENGNDDLGWQIFTDAQNNVYVIGRTHADSTGDIITLKYDSAGVFQWSAVYANPGVNDNPVDIKVFNGSVYVTGTLNSSSGLANIVTIRYSPTGTQLWAKIFNSPWNNQDRAVALAIDLNGNIIVGGMYRSTFVNDHLVVIKYDASGNQA